MIIRWLFWNLGAYVCTCSHFYSEHLCLSFPVPISLAMSLWYQDIIAKKNCSCSAFSPGVCVHRCVMHGSVTYNEYYYYTIIIPVEFSLKWNECWEVAQSLIPYLNACWGTETKFTGLSGRKIKVCLLSPYFDSALLIYLVSAWPPLSHLLSSELTQ